MDKPSVIAVIAAGEMGSAIGRRLAEHGLEVLTSLQGRSAATRARAEAAGLIDAPDAQIAAADMILSIAPPADALALAERLAPAIAAVERKPLYVDCNAVAPATAEAAAATVERAGARFVDAGIVGLAPRPGYTPAIYASGPDAARFAALGGFGLDVRVMDGPVGQASALKMCYAGLTKGLHAVGVSVILGAIEAGVEEAFFAELAHSQPELLAYFVRRTPGIFGKAYRWVAEMEEIGAFLGGGGERLYQGASAQFERLAGDHRGPQEDEAALRRFLGRSAS